MKTNIFEKMFPVIVLNRKCDELLTNKPKGFHPIKKREYRIECEEVLHSYQFYQERNHIRGKTRPYTNSVRKRIEKLKIATGR